MFVMSCGEMLKRALLTFISVKDEKYNKFYKAKIVHVDTEEQTLQIHFVGFNERYDEVLPMSSGGIESWDDSGADGRKRLRNSGRCGDGGD